MRQRSIISFLLMFILGGFFIFSAISKMIPNVNYFDMTIQNQLGLQAGLSAFLSRLIIGVELSLGVLLLFQQKGTKKWVLMATLSMLVVFSIYLVRLYFVEGNNVNCGCMGDLIEMSPLASLLKNIALIVINILLFFIPKKHSFLKPGIQLGILILPIAAIFLIHPLKEKQEMIWEEVLIAGTMWEDNTSLTQGKAVVAFLSLTCGHCVDMATALNQLKKEEPDLPVTLVFQTMGNIEETQEAFKRFETATDLLLMPVHFADRKGFVDVLIKLGHDGVPVLIWLEDGKIMRSSYGATDQISEIQRWIN